MKKQSLMMIVILIATSHMKFILSMNQVLETKKETTNPVTEFLKRNPNIEQSKDPNVMREGIFACTTVLLQPEQEQNGNEIKTMRKILYNKLSEVLGSAQDAKNFLYGVDTTSDKEDNDENALLQHKSSTKFVQLKEKINVTKKAEKIFTIQVQNLEKIKEKKESTLTIIKNQLEQTHQEVIQITQQFDQSKEELKSIQQALGILSLKQKITKNKMCEEQKKLSTNIQVTAQNITLMKKTLSQLTDQAEITQKKLALETAEKKLFEYQIALEYLSKDLSDIEGTTGFLGNFGWKIGLVHYAPKNIQENNTNTNNSFNNNEIIAQINPTIVVNIETNQQSISSALSTTEKNDIAKVVKEVFEEIEKEIPSVYEHTNDINNNNSYNENTIIAQINPENPSVIININTQHQPETITEQAPSEDQKDK